jgi:hypothetical protein
MGNETDQHRAYALSGAFVRDLLERNGQTAAAEILTRVGRGVPFEDAFADVTRMTPASAEAEFWVRQHIWTTWLPIISSPATLWSVVTILALVAIFRRRQKNKKIEKQWEEEEGNGSEPL